MRQSRYDYSLCETSTVPIPPELAISSEFVAVEVLYHSDAPFSFRELYDDVLPTLGENYQANMAYFLTPLHLKLEYTLLGRGYIAVLTFDSNFYDMTLEHMKYLKKAIGHLAKRHPCEIVFKPESV